MYVRVKPKNAESFNINNNFQISLSGFCPGHHEIKLVYLHGIFKTKCMSFYLAVSNETLSFGLIHFYVQGHHE